MSLIIPTKSFGNKKEHISKIKQAKIPRLPKTYNGSKSIPGKHNVKFERASKL